MADTNPDVLRLAREIAADHFGFLKGPLRQMYVEGRDDDDFVQIAIAAIERTTQLGADRLRADVSEYAESYSFVLTDAAETLERYDHLRQPEKGSTDE